VIKPSYLIGDAEFDSKEFHEFRIQFLGSEGAEGDVQAQRGDRTWVLYVEAALRTGGVPCEGQASGKGTCVPVADAASGICHRIL